MQRFYPYFKDRYFYLPASSAFLLALSRYPLKLNFFVFFAFLPLLHLLTIHISRQDIPTPKKKIVKAALAFSTTYILVALHWIGVVTVPGLLGIFILYCFYFSILFLITFKVAFLYPKLNYVIMISSWMSFEWLQNYGELRFPWFNIGYSLADYLYLVQIAEIGGIYLLSSMILIINILVFLFINSFPAKKSITALIIVLIILSTWIAAGRYRYKTLPIVEEDIRVAMVQVSIPQYLKWSEDFYDSTLTLYSQYTEMASETEPDLIVLPESAIPDYILRSEKAFNFVGNLAEKAGTDILLGLPHYEVDRIGNEYEVLYLNAAAVFSKDREVSPLYIKNILVPVGERIPFMDYIPLLKRVDFGQANWEYGKESVFYQIHKGDKTFTYSPTICFEIAFPDLTRRIAAEGVDFIVNITNDAWFKKTIGPYQHGMMTVVRAVETRTQYYRAANTGISMIVTPRGNILRKTTLFEKTVIEDILYTYPFDSVYVRAMRNYPVIFLIITICLTISTVFTMSTVKK